MIQELYTIKDDVAGNYLVFDMCVNEGTAIRSFKAYCEKVGNIAKDLSLYKSAEFDTLTGKIIGQEPCFVLRGVYDEV